MSAGNWDRRAVLERGLGVAGVLALVREIAWSDTAWAGAATDAAPQQPPAEPPKPAFSFDMVRESARKLAQTDFVKPSVQLPEPFNNLSYDQYRDIRFKQDQAIWRGAGLDTEVQFFPMGWLYDTPVEMYLVENGEIRSMAADGHLFALGPLVGKAPEQAPFGFSGFRIHGPLNRSDYFDEFAVFQGASYLRAVGRGQGYGASARGLAINTARPGGEEFPFFKAFWIEKPAFRSSSVVVNALLDSPSVTGAYRFVIQPGPSTVMDVDATLFPRKAIAHVGIAPLTSMYLSGPANERHLPDFRPSVHDSEGLAIVNGGGERLWRPLTNPKTLQISAFIDKDPKGFGLQQRDRRFDNFEDLEAHYERRPTVWIEPRGPWGEGVIELVEIPVDVEIHDNIAAFWKPAKELEAGAVYQYAYRIFWGEPLPIAWAPSRVAKTRIGNSKNAGMTLFVVDFEGLAVKDLRDLPVAELSQSAGKSANIVVQRNPEISGVRVSFELNPDGADLVELRLGLKSGDQLISESWLYRWTKQ